MTKRGFVGVASTIAMLLLAGGMAVAAQPELANLPPPQTDGGMPLMQALLTVGYPVKTD